ncbi:hypothetical protein EXE53_25615 [Halorubrum sp. SD626R]|uniref:hypothetical protein n=1 Tax=Halorubrum TaxID=56688 RepID=UPI0010F4F0EF|nr:MULTISPECIES: hypothetical protein [Halorubrum]TKX77615.1 hypothetical protein EXE53_25615 [Halorubrum sp. SD626R]
MTAPRPGDDEPIDGPATGLRGGRVKALGAVLWTLTFLSVTVVILVSGGRLTALGPRDVLFVLLRTFGGVLAFFVVFPVIMKALSASRLR